MASMQLEGVEGIISRIEEMGREGTKVEGQALKKAGQVILEEMRANAPTSDSPRQPKGKTQMWRTGKHGKELLKVSGVRNKDGRRYILAGLQKGDNSKAFYLKFKEFGSSKETAHPFMGPAYERKKKEATEIIKQEIRNALNLK